MGKNFNRGSGSNRGPRPISVLRDAAQAALGCVGGTVTILPDRSDWRILMVRDGRVEAELARCKTAPPAVIAACAALMADQVAQWDPANVAGAVDALRRGTVKHYKNRLRAAKAVAAASAAADGLGEAPDMQKAAEVEAAKAAALEAAVRYNSFREETESRGLSPASAAFAIRVREAEERRREAVAAADNFEKLSVTPEKAYEKAAKEAIAAVQAVGGTEEQALKAVLDNAGEELVKEAEAELALAQRAAKTFLGNRWGQVIDGAKLLASACGRGAGEKLSTNDREAAVQTVVRWVEEGRKARLEKAAAAPPRHVVVKDEGPAPESVIKAKLRAAGLLPASAG